MTITISSTGITFPDGTQSLPHAATDGAVGSYMFCGCEATYINQYGATINGSKLEPAGPTFSKTSSSVFTTNVTTAGVGAGVCSYTALSGTWRCMGYSYYTSMTDRGSTTHYKGLTLWVRIS